MISIADLLIRFRQGSRPASDTQVAAMTENRDRSSMAEFVRILQVYDQDQYGRSLRATASQAAKKTRDTGPSTHTSNQSFRFRDAGAIGC